MTVKRPLEELTYPKSHKRSCSSADPGDWPFDCADLNRDLDLSAKADQFLEQIGVCRGVHAAADDNLSARYGTYNRLACRNSWQGLSEQSW